MSLSALEQLEAKTERLHTTHNFIRAREKAAEAPGTLTDEDLAVLDFFGGKSAGAEARAAREKALHPGATSAATVTAPTAATGGGVAFPDALWDTEAPDQVAAMERWSVAHAMRTVPLRIWWKFVDAGREKREALETRVETLERRIAELESRATLKDCGDWTHGQFYDVGAVVRSHGSIWICKDTHFSTGEELDHSRFKLWIKRSNQR